MVFQRPKVPDPVQVRVLHVEEEILRARPCVYFLIAHISHGIHGIEMHITVPPAAVCPDTGIPGRFELAGGGGH